MVRRGHRWGLSNRTAVAWLGKQLKGLLVGIILWRPVGSLLYRTITALPQR